MSSSDDDSEYMPDIVPTMLQVVESADEDEDNKDDGRYSEDDEESGSSGDEDEDEDEDAGNKRLIGYHALFEERTEFPLPVYKGTPSPGE